MDRARLNAHAVSPARFVNDYGVFILSERIEGEQDREAQANLS
jgi:hypothetical protein